MFIPTAHLLNCLIPSQNLHADRVAMRMEREGKLEEYTYSDLRELILRAAAFLAQVTNIKPEDHVALIGENSPEWGISLFRDHTSWRNIASRWTKISPRMKS